MDIKSKEFKQKYKELFELGYCEECIALLTGNATIGQLCKKCKSILFENQFKTASFYKGEN